jgi:hypothetical protein
LLFAADPVFEDGYLLGAGAALRACSEGIPHKNSAGTADRKRFSRMLQSCARLDIENSPMHMWDRSAIVRIAGAGLPTTFAHSMQVDRMIPLQMVL